MKVVIFSGGRGSSALTVGLRNSLSKEKTSSITNVTNAYDDGKSTGEIRRVFSNNILGPSDVRKLHEVQWEAYGKDRNVDKFFGLFFGWFLVPGKTTNVRLVMI